MATKTMMRKPYEGADRFEAGNDEDLEISDKGYILKTDKPAEQTEEEILQEELDANPDESLEPEDKSFKKRYGDLRRHSAEQSATEKKKIAELEQQLADATSQKTARPLDDEALNSFEEENPEAAEVFTSIAQRENEKSLEEVQALKAQLADAKLESDMAKAEAYVARRHSDIEDIKNSDEFHDWAESKSQMIQDGIYANATDGDTLADIIDSYKAETGLGGEGKKPSKKAKMKEAASELISSKSKSEPDTKEKPIYSLRDIDTMSLDEYEKIEDDILLARAEGRLVP